MKINFVVPPLLMSGGPIAIMEYANRFAENGHDVTMTIYPSYFWPDEWKKKGPFPWFKNFKGRFIYEDLSKREIIALKILQRLHHRNNIKHNTEDRMWNSSMYSIYEMEFINEHLIKIMPDCDINIATWWATAFPTYYSKKGKPVYLMQHFEEVFYVQDDPGLINRLLARMTYELPMYRLANSSWLQKIIKEKYGIEVPYSNNAIRLSDFSPAPKLSDEDGRIRILTFSRPDVWKGFLEVAKAMGEIHKEYGDKVEWHVFGQEHQYVKPDNPLCPYIHHAHLPFSELTKMYAKCDIVVCCSWYESFPLPPLESMASGTATISTEYGVEDYCEDGYNCLIVKSRNIPTIVDAIKRLIDNKELRDTIANNGYLTSKKYGWDEAVKDHERILTEIHEGKTKYDRYRTTCHGIFDGNGVLFEEMPPDLAVKYPDGTLLRYCDELYLISNGAKHKILPHIVEECFPNQEIVQIKGIDFCGIPLSYGYWSKYDIDLDKVGVNVNKSTTSQ